MNLMIEDILRGRGKCCGRMTAVIQELPSSNGQYLIVAYCPVWRDKSRLEVYLDLILGTQRFGKGLKKLVKEFIQQMEEKNMK